jgi:hypothetical protein
MRPHLAALAALALSLLAVPARAAVTQPAGLTCGYDAFADSAGWHVLFRAGPLTLPDEDDPSVVRTGTVTCSLREQPTYGSAAYASATSAPAPGQATLAAAVVDAPTLPDYGYGLCTSLDVDGTTLYWNDPYDRNVDGWWTTDPNARCDDLTETLDLRIPADQPYRTVFAAANTAAGEAEPAVDAFEHTACADPSVAAAIADVWECGYPSTMTSVSFVRAAGTAVLRGEPTGWACTDVHTGLPVTRGSALATPDPGVSCAPPPAYGATCYWAQVSGYLVPSTLGRVAVTSRCGAATVTRWLVPAQGRLVEQWSGAYYGTPPLYCGAAEDTTGEPAYTVSCNVFG